MITLAILFAVTIVVLARQLRRAWRHIDALDDRNVELSIQVIGGAVQVKDLLEHASGLAAQNVALVEQCELRDKRINDLLEIVRMYNALYGAQVLRDAGAALMNSRKRSTRWIYLN